MDKHDKEKAEKMKVKTEEVRRAFNLPDTESCIQDYSCALSHVSGRVFITQNFIAWIPGTLSIGQKETLIPFRRVKNIKKEKNALVFDNAISVETDEKNHFFSSFLHRDETFNLLEYLWKNPPYYVDIPEEESIIATKAQSSSQRASIPAFDEVNLVQSNASSNSSKSVGGNQVQIQTKVDTQSTKNALRVANQAKELGTGTLVELTIQAESLDRIEGNVEDIHYNVDKANKILKGMESIGGAISNAVGKDTQGPKPSKGYIDRTLNVVKEYPPVDFPILEKLSNDHLAPAFLRLFEDKFMCADFATKKAKDGCIWPYEKVEKLQVRARHQHLDIRFKENLPRFRMCVSDIQGVVNEIILRTKPGQVEVIFEPGTRVFPYGKPNLKASNDETKPTQRNQQFKRTNQKITTTIFKDVDDQTKKQIDEQDNDLDQLSDILGDLNAIANTIGGELDRQIEQIDRVNDRVDDANAKLKRTNQRIDKML